MRILSGEGRWTGAFSRTAHSFRERCRPRRQSRTSRWRLALLLPAWCHLRRGEVLALQRRHIDLLHGKIVVEQAWSVPMGSKAIIGPPKTEAGVRTFTIPPNVLPALEDHLAKFVGPEPTAWVFGTSTGTCLSPRNFNRAWGKARGRWDEQTFIFTT